MCVFACFGDGMFMLFCANFSATAPEIIPESYRNEVLPHDDNDEDNNNFDDDDKPCDPR